MHSTLTIDGHNLETDGEAVARIYFLILKIMQAGSTEPLIIHSTVDGVDVAQLFVITPTSQVRASALPDELSDEVAQRLDGGNLMDLVERYETS
jgi:hypothetical protein